MPREVPQYISQLSTGSLPKVEFSTAGVEATNRISAQLGALAQGIEEKQAAIEKIQATTQLQVELNRQYQEFGSDPGKLREAQAGFKKGFIKGIKNPELAAQFEAGYDAIALPYLNKSTEIFKNNQDEALKLSIMQGTDAEIASAETIADGLISDVPEFSNDAGNALVQGMTRIERYKTAKKHDGSMLFSPSEIAAAEAKVKAVYEKKAEALRMAPLQKGVYSDPGLTALDIQAGKYDKVFKDQKEKDKWLKDSQARFEALEKSANVNRIIQGAVANDALYQKVQSGDVAAFEDIENYRANGGDPVFADTMRDSLLRIRPPESERAETFATLSDRARGLQLKKLKDGTYKVKNDEVTLESAIALYNDIMKAKVRGIPDLNDALKSASTAIVALGRKEQGSDDIGFWSDPAEPYDPGYDIIQKHLESQDKDEDYETKALLLRQFVNQADQIPEEIRKDPLLFQQAQEKIANFVIAGEQTKGMKNIPLTHIQKLRDDPSPAMRQYFDEAYGKGSAARILGQ